MTAIRKFFRNTVIVLALVAAGVSITAAVQAAPRKQLWAPSQPYLAVAVQAAPQARCTEVTSPDPRAGIRFVSVSYGLQGEIVETLLLLDDGRRCAIRPANN